MRYEEDATVKNRHAGKPLNRTAPGVYEQATDGFGQPFPLPVGRVEFGPSSAPGTVLPLDKVKLETLRVNDDLTKGGVKFDHGKARLSLMDPKWLLELMQAQTNEPGLRTDLIPVSMVVAVGRILTIGAKKYAERNWEAGMTWSRAYDACGRHLLQWADDTNDKDTRLNHIWHAACNLAFLIEWEQSHPEFDDRPYGPDKGPENAQTKL